MAPFFSHTQSVGFTEQGIVATFYTPFTRYNRLSNRFDNRLTVCLHDKATCQTGCQSGLTTGMTTVLNEQLFLQQVVTPGCITDLTTGCIHDTAGCQTGFTTARLYRVNGALQAQWIIV